MLQETDSIFFRPQGAMNNYDTHMKNEISGGLLAWTHYRA